MPANRQTVPRAAREAEILDAARVEFLDTGFDATTMASIARRAGMTSANVHYYFATKEALFAAVIRDTLAALATRLDAIDDPMERLRRYVSFHMANHRMRVAVQAMAARSPDVADFLADRDAWLAKTAGELVDDELDVATLVAVVTGLIEVRVPHAEPDRVLDHAAARLIRTRRSRR